MSDNRDRDACKDCSQHATLKAQHDLQEVRITALEVIVKEVPKMQARVHMLMYILIATMTILISISCFSFLQLVDFKKTYFEYRQKHTELHSTQALQQEQRYIDLINKLGHRVSILETKSGIESTK